MDYCCKKMKEMVEETTCVSPPEKEPEIPPDPSELAWELGLRDWAELDKDLTRFEIISYCPWCGKKLE